MEIKGPTNPEKEQNWRTKTPDPKNYKATVTKSMVLV